MKSNRKGFTGIEFVLGLAVIAMLVVAIYLFQQSRLQETTDDTMETMESITTYPTPSPIPTGSEEEVIDEATTEVNDLSDDLNDLDKIDDDLSLPNIDLTVQE
ncbi:hypothetical protein KC571_01815 [candidate division WWE3 bacterium]|uniref:Uncharacterized protein n=1 Tax=candidate division WWE3 bacterium TaxID=2053526 RepID=A0A955RPD5_UNCKA|nr:hypothetical protein [candidate division WWE3 bacterium]